MISLNLLPGYQKERLAKERIWLIVHAVVGLVLLSVTVSAIILTIARTVLIGQYTKIKQDTSLVNVEHLNLENNIDRLNKNLANADKMQLTWSKWTALLSDLDKIIPPSVTINYLDVNRESGSLRLNGWSPDRDTLLSTKAALENSPLLESLDAPLSNFLAKDNIEFRFTAKLRPPAK